MKDEAERQRQEPAMKREFIVAMTLFVAMAVVGTAFGLWFTYMFSPVRHTPATVQQPR